MRPYLRGYMYPYQYNSMFNYFPPYKNINTRAYEPGPPEEYGHPPWVSDAEKAAILNNTVFANRNTYIHPGWAQLAPTNPLFVSVPARPRKRLPDSGPYRSFKRYFMPRSPWPATVTPYGLPVSLSVTRGQVYIVQKPTAPTPSQPEPDWGPKTPSVAGIDPIAVLARPTPGMGSWASAPIPDDFPHVLFVHDHKDRPLNKRDPMLITVGFSSPSIPYTSDPFEADVWMEARIGLAAEVNYGYPIINGFEWFGNVGEFADAAMYIPNAHPSTSVVVTMSTREPYVRISHLHISY